MEPKYATRLRYRNNDVKLMGALAAFVLFFCFGAVQAQPQVQQCGIEPTDDLIAYGVAVTCEIDPIGDVDVFRFSGTAGETILVQVARRGGGNPCFRVFDPDALDLIPLQCTNSHSVTSVATLTKSGEYTVLVTENNNDATLPYTLVLESLVPPPASATTLTPSLPLSDAISPWGDLGFFVFQGEAGDFVQLQATRVTGGNPCLQVFNPDGTENTTLTCGSSSATAFPVLAQSGEYTVVIYEDANNSDMSYTVDYQCIVGVCPAQEVTRRYIGTTYLPDINADGTDDVVTAYQLRSTKQTLVQIKDGASGAGIKTIPIFGDAFKPIAITTIGDLNADSIPELALLATNLTNGQAVVKIADPITKAILFSGTVFGGQWKPIGITQVGDQNGDTIPDVGVLARRNNNNVTLKIKDPITGDTLNNIFWDK